MYNAELSALAQMSNRYGSDPRFVLAGGGNTSFKTADRLWIKGSGTALATIRPEDFVVMERSLLAQMWTANYPENEAERESAVLADMMNARVEGETRRPSVETLLHDLFPQSYILHVHPTQVNGLTCSMEGQGAMQRLFPDAVWVDACKPGYILALDCKKKMDAYSAANGRPVQVLFLQNHGIFFAADTVAEVDALAARVMDTLQAEMRRQPDLEPIPFDAEQADAIAAILRELYAQDGGVEFIANREVLNFDPTTKALSPDHIVYAKARQLALGENPTAAQVREGFDTFTAQQGYKPKVAFVRGLGMFACGNSAQEALTVRDVMLDAVKVAAYAESFGGVSPMPDWLIDFIINWEVEAYRSKVSLSSGK